MSRLIAFGCSCTYGNGLEDCLTTNTLNPFPSNLAWPKLLADKLSLECVNKGHSGFSNKRIWHKILNFDYKKDDVVLVLWTNKERFTVLDKKDQKTKDIGVWKEDPLSKWYYKMCYNDYDHLVDANLRISHSATFLDNLNIQNYHMFVQEIDKCFIPQTSNTLPIPVFSEFAEPYGLAPDNLHPSKEAHKKYTDLIYKAIKDETTLH